MVRRLGMVMVVAAVWLASTTASAQTLGDVTAATGVHGTLAKSGTMNAAGTIGTVKNALGKAVATKQGQLAGAGAQIGWGGKTGTGGWATKSGNGGWSAGGGATGWAVASASGGWVAGNSTGAWASGGWGSGR